MSLTFSQKRNISPQISAVLGMLECFYSLETNKQINVKWIHISKAFLITNMWLTKKKKKLVLKIFVSFESMDRILNWTEILWLLDLDCACYLVKGCKWTLRASLWHPGSFPRVSWLCLDEIQGVSSFLPCHPRASFSTPPSPKAICVQRQNTRASKHVPCAEEQDPAVDIHPHISLQTA